MNCVNAGFRPANFGSGKLVVLAAMTLAVVGLTAPPLAYADIVTDFVTTDDGRTRIFGGDTVDTSEDRLTATQSGGLVDNIILEFDISSLGVSAEISSASLVLFHDGFLSNTGGNPVPIETFVYAGDGAVTIDDFDEPGTNAGNFSVPLGLSDGVELVFDLTDLTEFQSIVDAGTGLATVRLETNSFATIQFASLENTSFAAPVLRIESVPEPSSAGMVILLSGLFLRRRRVA